MFFVYQKKNLHKQLTNKSCHSTIKIEKLLGFERFIFMIFFNKNINPASVTYHNSNSAFFVPGIYLIILNKNT